MSSRCERPRCAQKISCRPRRAEARRYAALLQCLAAVLILQWRPLAVAEEPRPDSRVLRVAADPNNLPFSNDKFEGFENRIAELLARDLNLRLEYVWHAQRRGFIRETLKDGNCDVVMGVPAGFDKALTTRPYYRSSYVFVSRKGARMFHDLRDPRLKTVPVGVQMIGADYANTPPAQALANQNIVTNVVGYMLYGDYRQPNPPAGIVRDVASGKLAVAIVWGPLAGYFASTLPVELSVVADENDNLPQLAFSICVGVRKSERELRDQLDVALARRQRDIEKILDEFHVVRVGEPNHS